MGNYRILYSIDDDRKAIDITRIAHRKDVYEDTGCSSAFVVAAWYGRSRPASLDNYFNKAASSIPSASALYGNLGRNARCARHASGNVTSA